MTRPGRGFTLIELVVVMAVVALLVAIAAPRYLDSLERARENALRTTLGVLRGAIDQHVADRGRYPEDMNDLVDGRYLRTLPEDPITGKRDSWILLAPAPEAGVAGRVADIRSGAAGRTRQGTLYADL